MKRLFRNLLERRRVRGAFTQYLSPEMVDLVAADPRQLRLEGENREISFLVVELRDWDEVRPAFGDDLQALMAFTNRFLASMTDAVMTHEGTVDKFHRDRVVAFWNAPLEDSAHALHACRAALAMRAALHRLNAELDVVASGDIDSLEIVVGIDTGTCVVGNFGSDQRFDYSVMGRPVTAAFALMETARDAGVDIIIGASTRNEAGGVDVGEPRHLELTDDRTAIAYDLLGLAGG